MIQSVKIKGSYPLQIEEIVFDHGGTEHLSDRIAFIHGGFLIVASEKNGDPPTMYNTEFIRELRKVREIKPEPTGNIMWW